MVKKPSLQVSPYVRYDMVDFWRANWLLLFLAIWEIGEHVLFICRY